MRGIKIQVMIMVLLVGRLAAGTVHYTVHMSQPSNHLFQVEMRLQGVRGKAVVGLPVWTPGSYLVREFARNVQDVSAVSSDGRVLRIEKTDKNHWQVKARRGQDITIKYQVYAFENSVRTCHLDSDHALILPAGLLMYWQGQEDKTHTLHVDLPSVWSTITTALEPFGKPGNADFTARNYDELVDSPLELGNQHVIDFSVLGKPHQIALYGTGNYTDSVLVRDLRAIIEAEAELFGGLPYEHYCFIYHLGTGRGGLEHARSSVNFVKRWSFDDRKAYHGFLSLTAHEFLHTWNVKRLYPRGIASFDYDRENYLKELWLAEGFTAYYDELILARIGLATTEEYLKTLKDEINSLEARPGKNHQSVEAASWDAWIKFYRSDEHSPNATVSYYNKGLLVALLLDLNIIEATEGRYNLDDLMRRLYDEFARRQRGYTGRDVQKAAEALSGLQLDAFFSDYVSGLQPLPYAEALAKAGLQLDSTDSGDPWLGVRLTDRNGSVRITRVVEDSPAWRGGLNTGDELLALDGYRVRSQAPVYLKTRSPGDTVRCTVSRNGRLRELSVVLGREPVSIAAIVPVEHPTARQKTVYEKWLGSKPEE